MAQESTYYLVIPYTHRRSQHDTFTYHSSQPLQPGQLVTVPFGKQQTVGLIVQPTSRPSFTTKPVASVLPLPPLPRPYRRLLEWLGTYYATALPRILQTALPRHLTAQPRSQTANPSNREQPLAHSFVRLTSQQRASLEVIINGRDTRGYVLHGATGSGKTQIYIELAHAALSEGRSTVVLVPEIALTSQMRQQFEAAFGADVLLTHSAMTPTQRRNVWLEVLQRDRPVVVIGPRSALFMPFRSLGYIIVDESHDPSYKQEQSPRYHATTVAAYLAKVHGATFVLGSATPAISDYYLTTAGKLTLVSMPQAVHRGQGAQTTVIDLKDKRQLSRSAYLSRPLLKALETTLDRQKQSILFINRRGSARLALCQECGWIATCPDCQIPLTLHADQGTLRCHWCGYTTSPFTTCPECHQHDITFLGSGTKRIESEVQQLLPHARVSRLDRDSFDARQLDTLFKQLHSGDIDILVGTQMVTKGLDLPNVETVGVISADTMLYVPDFTANERTFQLLHQVSGRAGRRGSAHARSIIQTYNPTHPAVQAAITGTFDTFARHELRERRALRYPPFVYLLKLTTRYKTRSGARRAAERLVSEIRARHQNPQSKIQILGPAPAWRETLRGQYYWQIIIKSKRRQPLVRIANALPSQWIADLDPVDLL